MKSNILIVVFFIVACISEFITGGMQTETVGAIAPLAIAAGGAGLSALSSIFKSSPQMPAWLIDLVKGEFARDRTSQFVPNQAAFTAKGEADRASILGQLPVAQDQFNAQAASRGVFAGGESLSRLYSDVYAPIQQQANQAAATSQLNFEQLRLQGTAQAEQQKLQLLSLLSGLINPDESAVSKIAGTVGEIGSFGTKYGFLKELGVIGG